MTAQCNKEHWQGRCCCNCKNQQVIMKHPWNKGDGKGSVNQVMGYGCHMKDFELDDNKRPRVIFFDTEHGMCEMHDKKD